MSIAIFLLSNEEFNIIFLLVNGSLHGIYERIDLFFTNREKQQLIAKPKFRFLTYKM